MPGASTCLGDVFRRAEREGKEGGWAPTARALKVRPRTRIYLQGSRESWEVSEQEDPSKRRYSGEIHQESLGWGQGRSPAPAFSVTVTGQP